MIIHPDFDKVAFSIGPLKVHWYGLMYLVAFAAGWWLGRRQCARPGSPFRARDIDDIVFYTAIGVVAGGRLGYVLFYNFTQLVDEPLSLFRVWEGGMSFHGGLIGVVVAMMFLARSKKTSFFVMSDFVAPLVPIGLGAGRIGNFINGNLWGKPTELPWGVVFPDARAEGIARHPSQLYEAFLEGVVLFIVLWWMSRRPRPTMMLSGTFLLLYGLFRSLVELVRVPDAHLGYQGFDWLTRGQQLSLPMILVGVGLIWMSRTRRQFAPAAPAITEKPNRSDQDTVHAKRKRKRKGHR